MAYRVCIINPKVREVFDLAEPLNIVDIATYLKKAGITVKIIDEIIEDDVIAEVKSFKPDLVGFTALTCAYPRAVQLMKEIKSFGYRTIIGGPHVTPLPEDALRDGFDMVVVGEGEKILLEIISKGYKKGVYKVSKEKILKNEELLLPDRTLINMDFYAKVGSWSTRRTVIRKATVLAARGCPYQCIFCHNTWRDTPVRFLSSEAMVEEIEKLIYDYSIQCISFTDDDFFINRKRTIQFCELMLKKNIKIPWHACARADSLDEEIIDLACRAGFKRIGFGFESGSQRILDLMNKKANVEANISAYKLCRNHKLEVLGFYMVGNPTETKEDIRQTWSFIKRTPVDYFGITALIPFPGTKVWDLCKEAGYLSGKIDFSKFYYAYAPIQIPNTFAPKEVENIKRKILIKTYLVNPKLLKRFICLAIRYPLHMFKIILDHLPFISKSAS
ncbi:MAG: B12-binding domain-containing radical SAM protein [Candidatus Omnitrophica bacterium]|jgi:radical SAM superfamily enzyme YgiQ (UPF0313 family)|nr:B12-binding domain-containing radical SAM protein [Candidatus Omnitrophota bacterium]